MNFLVPLMVHWNAFSVWLGSIRHIDNEHCFWGRYPSWVFDYANIHWFCIAGSMEDPSCLVCESGITWLGRQRNRSLPIYIRWYLINRLKERGLFKWFQFFSRRTISTAPFLHLFSEKCPKNVSHTPPSFTISNEYCFKLFPPEEKERKKPFWKWGQKPSLTEFFCCCLKIF